MFQVISHAEDAKSAKLYTLLLTLALEGSQLHATESAEVTNGKVKTENVESLTFSVGSLTFCIMISHKM